MHVLAKMRRLCTVAAADVVVFILFSQNTLKHWRLTFRMRLIFATTSTSMSYTNSNRFMNGTQINRSEIHIYDDSIVKL